MGIDISSKLLVGRYAEEILENVELDEDTNEVEYLEDLGLEYASELYDCCSLDCVWGIAVYGGTVTEVIDSLKEAEEEFLRLTGLQPLVYQLPDVT